MAIGVARASNADLQSPRHRYHQAIRPVHPSGIQYRLFSEISKNWAGGLSSYETILKYIRTTTTLFRFREYAHTLSGVVIRRASKSLTSDAGAFRYKGPDSTQMELHHPTVLKTGTYFVAGP